MKNKRAVAAIMAVFILVLFSIMGLVVCSLLCTQSARRVCFIEAQQALQIAGAGSQYSLWRIADNDYKNWTFEETDERPLGSGTYTFEIQDKKKEEKKVITCRGYVPNEASPRAMRVTELETGYLFQGVPVAYWHMDEDSWSGAPYEVFDSSCNKNHGAALNGADTVLDGERDRVGSFDGGNDYINCGNDPSLDVDEITVEAWVKFTNAGGIRPVISMYSGGNRRWGLYYRNNRLRFAIYVSDSAEEKKCIWTPVLNTWYHVVGTADGSEIRVYIDGVDMGSPVSYSGKIDKDPADLHIGRVANNYFQGYIDETRVYDRALLPDEITAHFKEGMDQTMAKGMVGWWHMDEGLWAGNPDEVVDVSGSNNHGIAVNGAGTDASDVLGKCGDFDGGNDHINCGNNPSLDVDEITVEAWVKFTNKAGIRPIASMYSGGNRRWVLYYRNNSLRFAIYVSDSAKQKTCAFTPVLNTWYHIVGTADGSEIRVYIDGVDMGSPVSYSGKIDKDPADLHIGRAANNYFRGYIDEVRIYKNLALSQEQVQAHFWERRKDLFSDMGLLGWWHMDEDSWGGAPDEVVDASDTPAKDNHGVAENGLNTVAGGKLGRCSDFDGGNDYIEIGSDPSLDLIDEITLEAWIKPRDFASAGYIWVRNTNSYATIQYSGYLESDNRLMIKIMTTAWDTGYVFPVDKWKHIVVTIKSGGLIKYYIDGAYMDQHACPVIVSQPADKFNIGARNDVATGHAYYFDGLIDEPRVYSRILSEEEIQEHYEEGRGLVIIKGLAGCWHMDEDHRDEDIWDGANKVVDSSFYKNHGTAGPGGSEPNTVLEGISGGIDEDRGRGTVGNFDGNNDYVDCGDDSSLDPADPVDGTGEITLEAWIKPCDFTSAGYIWVRNTDSYANIQYSGYLESDNSLRIKVMGTAWNTGYVFPVDKWKHIVVTIKSSGLIKYYIDGEYKDQYSCPVIVSHPTDRFNIGARNNGAAGHAYYFDGLVDEVRVYARLLSPEEVLQHYKSGIRAGGISAGPYSWRELK